MEDSNLTVRTESDDDSRRGSSFAQNPQALDEKLR
jgi:hypothetical protein